MGFLGKYQHTLDPKGRVFVPKKFLDALPDSEPRHFVLTKGFEGSLTLYTQSSWSGTVAQMRSKARGERETRDFMRLIFASASQQSIDGAGRILIPDELRREAGLKREVVFVGLDDQIELWDLERWQAYHEQVSQNFEAAGRGML